MRAHAVDRAAVQHKNQISVLNGGNTLGNDELCRLWNLAPQRRANLGVGFGIDSGG